MRPWLHYSVRLCVFPDPDRTGQEGELDLLTCLRFIFIQNSLIPVFEIFRIRLAEVILLKRFTKAIALARI